MDVRPFTIDIDQAVLDDLHRRLSQTRWPEQVEKAGWDYGANLSYMQDLAEYWRDHFDWREQERFINSFANYRAKVTDMGIHMVWERGRGPDPMPLLITHGWPSSFHEMLKLIPLLTDPANYGGDANDSFDVIVPAVPGYAFSDTPKNRGFNYSDVADIWVHLMDGLGYPRFAAHSYDIGASIMGFLLRNHPERVVAYHTTEPDNPAPSLDPVSADLSAAEHAFLDYQHAWVTDEGGYAALQTTRPQTPAYALADSPMGMAAWLIEKWRAWTVVAGGDLNGQFTNDDLLTNITLYWVTDTLNSANRLYYERAHHPPAFGPGDTITVPLGVTLTNQPIERPPREYVERLFTDIRRWEEFARGGHFVALEEPELLATALRDFFRPFRNGFGPAASAQGPT